MNNHRSKYTAQVAGSMDGLARQCFGKSVFGEPGISWREAIILLKSTAKRARLGIIQQICDLLDRKRRGLEVMARQAHTGLEYDVLIRGLGPVKTFTQLSR